MSARNLLNNMPASSCNQHVVLNIDIDDCAMLTGGDGKRDADNDTLILPLSLNSSEMTFLRRLVAFQRLPSTLFGRPSARWNTVFQLFIVMIAFGHYLYTLGAFKNNTLEVQEMGLTLNSVKIIVWNARHCLFTVFGLFYFKSTHIDDFVRNLKLTPRSLKKAKRWITGICTSLVIFSVVAPAILRFIEMMFTPKADKTKEFSYGSVIGNTVFMVLVRLLALPIVIVYIMVYTLLYFEVKQFKRHIKIWPIDNKKGARNFLVDILVKCKNAERGFQVLLVALITILLLVFIPGVMSFVERAQNEGHMTYTISTTPWRGVAYNDNPSDMDQPLLGKEFSKRIKNTSLPIVIINMPVTSRTKTVDDEEAQIRIGLQIAAFLTELLSLYLPLVLLGKINKGIRRIPEVLQCVKFEDQQDCGYLFQSRVELDEMLKDLSNAHGVHILGMEITIIKTCVVAVMMPLFTLVLHVIFRHVDLAA